MKITSEMIKNLNNATGVGAFSCKEALELTEGDSELAEIYLKQVTSAVSRFKIVDGQRVLWTKEDYLNYSRELLDEARKEIGMQY